MKKGKGGLIMVLVVVLIAIGVILIQSNMRKNNLDTSESAKNALANKMSTTLLLGAVLLEEDEDLGYEDIDVKHISSSESAKVWIWDYAKNDKDVIQLALDGEIIADEIVLSNNPTELTIPANGLLRMTALDGKGDGVTYAIRFQINGTCYLGTLPQSESVDYTLARVDEDELYYY